MKLARRRPYAFVDTEALIVRDCDILSSPANREFAIVPYQAFQNGPWLLWQQLIGPANQFLATLGENDARALAVFFATVRRNVRASRSLTVANACIIDALSDLLAGSFLIDQVLTYGDARWKATGGAECATSALTTDEDGTFRSLSIMLKVFFPIWGEFLSGAGLSLTSPDGLYACLDTLMPLLCGSDRVRSVTNKIILHIASITTSLLPESWHEDVSVSPEDLNRLVLAELFVRHCVMSASDVPSHVWLTPCLRVTADRVVLERILERRDGARWRPAPVRVIGNSGIYHASRTP